MEHQWTLVSVLVGAFLGYFLSKLAEYSNRRRNTYDEAIQFLAEYRVQATGPVRSLVTPNEVLVAGSVLNRKIADQFSRVACEAWRNAYSFVSAGGFPSERTYDFDEARDKALSRMRTDLNLVTALCDLRRSQRVSPVSPQHSKKPIEQGT